MTSSRSTTRGDLESIDLSCSLALVLQELLSSGDRRPNLDTLQTALGPPSILLGSARHPPGDWPSLGQDLVLIEVGRLFGLTIRGLHPPEAAWGLEGVREFGQHFEASYRPLILKALEHGLPVLAWTGWPPPERRWGSVTSVSQGLIGFIGRPRCETVNRSGQEPISAGRPGAGDPGPSGPENGIEMVSPPFQVYVIERATPVEPSDSLVLDLARTRLSRVLHHPPGQLETWLFGPDAMERLKRLSLECLREPSPKGGLSGIVSVLNSWQSGAESTMRFLDSMASRCPDEYRVKELNRAVDEVRRFVESVARTAAIVVRSGVRESLPENDGLVAACFERMVETWRGAAEAFVRVPDPL